MEKLREHEKLLVEMGLINSLAIPIIAIILGKTIGNIELYLIAFTLFMTVITSTLSLKTLFKTKKLEEQEMFNESKFKELEQAIDLLVEEKLVRKEQAKQKTIYELLENDNPKE